MERGPDHEYFMDFGGPLFSNISRSFAFIRGFYFFCIAWTVFRGGNSSIDKVGRIQYISVHGSNGMIGRIWFATPYHATWKSSAADVLQRWRLCRLFGADDRLSLAV
jgi:hypothetical protein